MKSRHTGRLFFVIGMICIALALGLTGYNLWEQNLAEGKSRMMLEQVERALVQIEDSGVEAENRTIVTKTFEGYPVAAILKIPDLNLNLPVIGVWDESYLKTAPCLYRGDSFDEHLIIAAHNYDVHFGKIGLLQSADRVLLTDMSGFEHVYKVSLVETLPPDKGDILTSAEWDLTLFTCTYDLQNRIIVRCKREMSSASSNI